MSLRSLMNLRRHSALVVAALLLGTAAPSAAQQRGAASDGGCLQDRLAPDVVERFGV